MGRGSEKRENISTDRVARGGGFEGARDQGESRVGRSGGNGPTAGVGGRSIPSLPVIFFPLLCWFESSMNKGKIPM